MEFENKITRLNRRIKFFFSELGTKSYGKMVEGKELTNLINDLGENSEEIVLTSAEDWTTVDTYGRYKSNPVEEGEEINLYVFRKDVQFRDGTFPSEGKGHYSKLPGDPLKLYSRTVVNVRGIKKK